MRTSTLLIFSLMMTACSTIESRPPMGNRSITPLQVAQDQDLKRDVLVEWGGVIAEPVNLQTTTELQIIAYPLDSKGRPNLDLAPTGRFIAIAEGYLETADYSKGRQVTLSGHVSGIRQAKVGAADYAFPVVQASDIQLWSRGWGSYPRSNVRFGVGVGSGSWSGGRVGIGIGF